MLLPRVLTFMVPEDAMQTSKGQKTKKFYSVMTSTYYNNHSGKMTLIV